MQRMKGRFNLVVFTAALTPILTVLTLTSCNNITSGEKDTVTTPLKTKAANISPSPKPSQNPVPSSSPTSSPSGAPLSLTAPAQVALGLEFSALATGGKTPYNFSIASGSCTIVSASAGTVKAASSAGSCSIRVTDTNLVSESTAVEITSSQPPIVQGPDPRLVDQQHFVSTNGASIHADEAWKIRTDCSPTKIAVIDTGVDMFHPDLQGNFGIATMRIGSDPTLRTGIGANFTGESYPQRANSSTYMNELDVRDQNYHGTHVAGIIGAVGNNSVGVAGLCWKAQMIIVKSLDYKGEGAISDVIDAVNFSINAQAKIINMSLSGVTSSVRYDQSTCNKISGSGNDTTFRNLCLALKQASDAGILLIIAAGNENKNIDANATATYPASFNFPNQITVGSIDITPGSNSTPKSSFSNFGAVHVEIGAPGSVNRPSTEEDGIQSLSPKDTAPTETHPDYYLTKYNNVECVKDGAEVAGCRVSKSYLKLRGTSMAAPIVTGAAALLWSQFPSMTASQVKTRILSTNTTNGGSVVRNETGTAFSGKRVLDLTNLLKP